MKKFIFRESKDKNVLAFISVATVLMLVYAFAIALLNDKCALAGIGFYLVIIFPVLLVITGKAHKYMGLAPLYIAFLPIIYLGFSSKKWST